VLTKTRSLLITNDSRESESEKIRYAHEHNIPVVTGEWLVECLKQHEKLSYESYLIKPSGERSLLGDKFKRKLNIDHSGVSKRPLLDKQLPSGRTNGEGNLPQESRPSRSGQGDGKFKRTEGRILQGCTIYISKQLKACAYYYPPDCLVAFFFDYVQITNQLSVIEA
jgi:hypothetical protein